MLGCALMASVLAVAQRQMIVTGFRQASSSMNAAVLQSLTAAKDSASAAQRSVDKSLDYMFENVFDFGVLYNIIDEELL
jgi:hypothetical protein